MKDLFFVFRWFGFRAGFTYLYDSFKRRQVRNQAQLTMPTNADRATLIYYSDNIH